MNKTYVKGSNAFIDKRLVPKWNMIEKRTRYLLSFSNHASQTLEIDINIESNATEIGE